MRSRALCNAKAKAGVSRAQREERRRRCLAYAAERRVLHSGSGVEMHFPVSGPHLRVVRYTVLTSLPVPVTDQVRSSDRFSLLSLLHYRRSVDKLGPILEESCDRQVPAAVLVAILASIGWLN